MSRFTFFNKKAYCAWSKNEEDLYASASGGIFYSLAKKYIEDGGFVVGAVYSEDYKSVRHIISKDVDDIKKMRGSKYSQSNYSGIIDQIEAKCKCGYKVLFSGTPCQCFVVKNIIKSDGLICIDLICNGLQDRRILESEINRLELKAGAKITFYTMRYKKNRLHLPIYMYAKFDNGNQFEEQFYQSVLGRIYGARLALQQSCYHCQFKGISRLGDITLGDYRGYHSLRNTDINKSGASTIIVNTENGNLLLNRIKCDLVLHQAKSIDEVLWSNNRIVISGYKPSNKRIKLFWDVFNEKGIEDAAKLSEQYISRMGNVTRRIVDRALLIKYMINYSLHL